MFISYLITVIFAALLQLTVGSMVLLYVRIFGGTKYNLYLYQQTHIIDGKEYPYYVESANGGILTWLLPKRFLTLPMYSYGMDELSALHKHQQYITSVVELYNERRAKMDKPLIEEDDIRITIKEGK